MSEQAAWREWTEQQERPAAPGEGSEEPKLKPINRAQMTMTVVDVERLIAADHKARAIWDLMERLDWRPYWRKIRTRVGENGRPAIDPKLLASVWIYGLSEGMQTAREIAREMEYEPGLRWLCGLETINHHTLSDFVSDGGEEVKELFIRVLGLLESAELVSLDRVMHDGTKIKAQASGRSFRGEKKLQQHLERAREVVEAAAAAEQPQSGGGESRTAAARNRAARERQQRVERALAEWKTLQADSAEAESARASETDPDARIMKQADGGFAPSYNVQISTEASHRIVVGVDVTQAGNDYEQLEPAVDQVKQNLGETPKQVVVDGGYSSQANIVKMEATGIDLIGSLGDEKARKRAAMKRLGIDADFGPGAFEPSADGNTLRCPAGQTLVYIGESKTHGYLYRRYRAEGSACLACDFQPRCCPRNPEKGRSVSVVCEPPEVTAFREKMASEAARLIYRERAEVAETPNAWIKDKFGLRQFRLRGLAKVRSEAIWACLTYNVLQWVRLRWLPGLALAT